MVKTRLDDLPVGRRYAVGRAKEHEIGELIQLGVRSIPGLTIIEPAIRRIHAVDPDTIFAARGARGLMGGIAFLYLSAIGLTALVDGRFDPADPAPEHLAPPPQIPAAIYGWAMYMPGQIVAAMGAVMRLLQQPRFAAADIYARPVTQAAIAFHDHTGFEPVDGIAGLNVYRRRLPPLAADKTPSAQPATKTASRRRIEIKLGVGADDILMVYSIRSAVYIGEQECPYAEEFDGNDWCATHFLGLVDGEPAGCFRARYFGSFVKLERLAVRKNYRSTRIALDLVRYARDHVRRKGFCHIYGHAREGLEKFWAHFGAKPMDGRAQFAFSDYNYSEMYATYPALNNAVTVESGPYVIIRPEGKWDEPGPSEASLSRPARRSDVGPPPRQSI